MAGTTAGRKLKPNMIRVNIKLDKRHQEWLTSKVENALQEDGSKDNVSSYIFRLIEAEIERIEKEELYAQKRSGIS